MGGGPTGLDRRPSEGGEETSQERTTPSSGRSRQPELRNALERALVICFLLRVLRIIAHQDGHFRRAPDPAHLHLEPSPDASHRATLAREGRAAPPCLEKLPRSATAADLYGGPLRRASAFLVAACLRRSTTDAAPQEAPAG